MVRGDDACALTGIPQQHAEVFQSVADGVTCMISSRAVGKYATGLILEGYASKGFHNKAKSCNWGPMAGFVLADPRFTKAPELGKQAQALKDAQHHGAKEVPVVISEARRRWLLKENCMRPSAMTAMTHYYFAASPQGDVMLFVLQRASNVQGANGAEMWTVSYAHSEGRVGFADHTATERSKGHEYLPVLAMRDPQCALPPENYRSATTGDYDLFAIYARADNYDPDRIDRRMVSHAALERRIDRGWSSTGEDEHLGNMTERIKGIRDRLNEGVIRSGYTGGEARAAATAASAGPWPADGNANSSRVTDTLQRHAIRIHMIGYYREGCTVCRPIVPAKSTGSVYGGIAVDRGHVRQGVKAPNSLSRA